MIIALDGGLRARLSGPGPFLARPAKDDTPEWHYWYVAGPDGRRNVLTFPDYSGAVLTDRHTAEAIMAAIADGAVIED